MASLKALDFVFFFTCVTLNIVISAKATTLEVTNNCPYTVWAAAVPGGGKRLNKGEKWNVTAKSGQNKAARIWGRTNCNFDASGKGRCETGGCNGVLQCTSYGKVPTTLAEYSIGLFGNQDFIDMSVIQGFNVPMEFSSASRQCKRVIRCTGDIIEQCPEEVKVPGGCNGACPVFQDQYIYCCNSGKCVPTLLSKFFKQRCPDVYTYPKDDSTNLFSCPTGTNYKVIFCPPPSAMPPNVSSSSALPPNSNSTDKVTKKGKEKNTSRTIIVAVASILGFLILAFCSFMCIRTRNRNARRFQNFEGPDELVTLDSLKFDIEIIRTATDDFSPTNALGRGGFGIVYKGTLSNGQDIAVKRLSKNSGQGDTEFKNEVLLVAKLQHRNLVRLLGFCIDKDERLLVYEFVSNGSLDHILFDPIKHTDLDWETRYKIIGGIARGILYLHEDSRLRIIHRDLKAGNILLDQDMCPKIADFGLARLFGINETQGSTNRIVGTYGYMAPEYAMHGQFSVKTDVFSFGVLVLEIISGRKNNFSLNGEEVENLLSYAWTSWRGGKEENFVDSSLSSTSTKEIKKCISIGLLCVQEKVADRPTMASVVHMLNSEDLTLPSLSRPALFTRGARGNVTSSSSGSRGEILPLSTDRASITELLPR